MRGADSTNRLWEVPTRFGPSGPLTQASRRNGGTPAAWAAPSPRPTLNCPSTLIQMQVPEGGPGSQPVIALAGSLGSEKGAVSTVPAALVQRMSLRRANPSTLSPPTSNRETNSGVDGRPMV